MLFFYRRVIVDEIQLDFTLVKGKIDAVFILIKFRDENCSEAKSFKCFLEKAFARVPRKVLEFLMRIKGISEVLFRSVMNLYEGRKKRE